MIDTVRITEHPLNKRRERIYEVLTVTATAKVHKIVRRVNRSSKTGGQLVQLAGALRCYGCKTEQLQREACVYFPCKIKTSELGYSLK